MDSEKENVKKQKNPHGVPWRFGAMSDNKNVWHPWIYNNIGEPVELDDSDVLKFIVDSVNKANPR